MRNIGLNFNRSCKGLLTIEKSSKSSLLKEQRIESTWKPKGLKKRLLNAKTKFAKEIGLKLMIGKDKLYLFTNLD